MDKTHHLMAEKNKKNENSQKGQVTPKKKYLKKENNKLLIMYIFLMDQPCFLHDDDEIWKRKSLLRYKM
jgi:hypothetical protein